MIASGIATGLGLLAGISMGPIAILVLPATVGALQMVRGRIQPQALLLVLVAASVGVLRGLTEEPVAGSDLIAQSIAAEGVVREIPVPGGDFERVVVDVDRLQLQSGEWQDAADSALVYLPESSRGVSRGDRVLLLWDVTPGAELDPGYRSFVQAQGASASAWAWKVTVIEPGPEWLDALGDMRRRVSGTLETALPGGAGALASGIVTGDDSALGDGLTDAFRRTGTSHLTAVSGQNVALLIGFLGLWLRPGRPLTRLLVNVFLILAVWSYVLMVGLEPPAIRAAVVASLTLVGVQLGRRPDPLTLLALTLGGMAMLDPGMVSSVSFWLSGAASWALCSTLRVRHTGGVRGMLIDTTKGVTAANLATFPIILWAFGWWSPISLLANVLIGPVMTAAFPATYGLALVAGLAPSVAPAIAWGPGILLDLAIAIVERLSAISGTMHLPLDDHRAAVVIALPCFAALLALSRDGARWRGVMERRYAQAPLQVRVLAYGVVAGGVLGGVLWLILP